MSKELIVSATRHETRIAILEDDSVVEIFYQREKEYSLAGSIHKGKVTRVLPGMQSAFVDIGLERDAFLYVSDFFEDNEEYDKVVSSVEEKVLKLEKGPERALAGKGLCGAKFPGRSSKLLRKTLNPCRNSPRRSRALALDSARLRSVVTRPAEIRTEREPRGDGRDRGGRWWPGPSRPPSP